MEQDMLQKTTTFMRVIEDQINRRRRQIHVHSTMYYHLHKSIIPDHLFDKWSKELVVLHHYYSDLIDQGYEPKLFGDWSGETGMHLPTTDYSLRTAHWLLERSEL